MYKKGTNLLKIYTKFFIESNKTSSSVTDESSKSPSQSSNICNNEAQHYVDSAGFDVNLPVNYKKGTN